jgi:3-hydroxybutyryl-CoA dehydrogenase
MSAEDFVFGRVAILGSGTMGAGFAQLLALGGVPSAIADATPEAAEQAKARLLDATAAYAQRGLVPGDSERLVDEHVSPCATIEDAVAGVDLVIEAVPEDPELKHAILDAAELAAPAGAVITTNTSAIPIGDLGARRRDASRFLGMHWFNPPQWVPCVELIPTPATAPEHVEALSAFLVGLGKTPCVVGDGAGFVGNRIQFAMFREACRIVEDGLATPQTVDAVVRSSFGFRLPFFGPFEIADMAGLDVYAGAYDALVGQFGDRLSCPPAITERVARGELGAKSGKGFLEHTPESARATATWRDAAYASLSRLLGELPDREA